MIQFAKVTSVIDSPTVGTIISFTSPVAEGPELFSAAGAALASGALAAGVEPSSMVQMTAPISKVSPA